MSLDFSVERMKNYNVLTTIVYPREHPQQEAERKWHPVTNALIFGTMAIGMNTITEANWQEFYNRLNMWERCVRPQLSRGDIPVKDQRNFITPLEVYMHIGLHTNASNKTKNQFLKDCYGAMEDNNKYSFKDVKINYLGLSLDDITEEDWQRAWRLAGEVVPANTETLVAKVRDPDTPVGPLGPTENVSSVEP